MEPKRILICTSGPVLGFAVENLLASHEALDVIRIPGEDRCEMLQAVTQFRPGVIVLDESAIMEDGALLISLLEEAHDMQVIGVSGEDNWLHLYSKRDILIRQADDLAEAIQSS